MNTLVGPLHMYIVMTQVKLLPGAHERCAELFRQTNPNLVRTQNDWLRAQMAFEESTQTVTVLAKWRNIEAYEVLSTSAEFQDAMKQFSPFFAAPPETTVNKVLVDMAGDDQKKVETVTII